MPTTIDFMNALIVVSAAFAATAGIVFTLVKSIPKWCRSLLGASLLFSFFALLFVYIWFSGETSYRVIATAAFALQAVTLYTPFMYVAFLKKNEKP